MTSDSPFAMNGGHLLFLVCALSEKITKTFLGHSAYVAQNDFHVLLQVTFRFDFKKPFNAAPILDARNLKNGAGKLSAMWSLREWNSHITGFGR